MISVQSLNKLEIVSYVVRVHELSSIIFSIRLHYHLHIPYQTYFCQILIYGQRNVVLSSNSDVFDCYYLFISFVFAVEIFLWK